MEDFSATAMIPAIEESLREFWANYARSPLTECHVGPDMTRLYTGIPKAFLNGVNSIHLPASRLDEIIDATISYYMARHAKWEWIVGPLADPPNLKAALESKGLSVQGEDIGMAIDLHADQPKLPGVDRLEMIRVQDDETLKTWADTVGLGFTAPELSSPFGDLERSLGILAPSYQRYLGYLDGQPVATTALLLGTKVAGIYCVATVPSARKQGIGAVITQHALVEAKRMGYSTAVLQASGMGRPVYSRLGFQEFSTLLCYEMVE
jgi:GNAT superfamily N-acetyltransferase